jgi:hypothetical protein
VRASAEIQVLEAEVSYCRDRIALLRAKMYGRGIGSGERLKELQQSLESAELRLREARSAKPV